MLIIVLYLFSDDFVKMKSIPKPVLMALYSLFGQTAPETFRLLDRKCVTRIQCEKTQRICFRVKSADKNSLEIFYVFPKSWRCSCGIWTFHTLTQEKNITCKHVLATKICQAILEVSENDQCPYMKKEIIKNEKTFIQLFAEIN